MAKRQTAQMNQSVEEIVSEFHDLAASIDELLASANDSKDEVLMDLKAKAADRLKQARAALGRVERTAKEVATKSDDYVHDNPWTSIAVGAGVGLVIGLLIGRR
jgi:ElaB/YqjD/DUF883 family membrane-anchored ribosome-binding protein